MSTTVEQGERAGGGDGANRSIRANEQESRAVQVVCNELVLRQVGCRSDAAVSGAAVGGALGDNVAHIGSDGALSRASDDADCVNFF